jgi:hypothetical protein
MCVSGSMSMAPVRRRRWHPTVRRTPARSGSIQVPAAQTRPPGHLAQRDGSTSQPGPDTAAQDSGAGRTDRKIATPAGWVRIESTRLKVARGVTDTNSGSPISRRLWSHPTGTITNGQAHLCFPGAPVPGGGVISYQKRARVGTGKTQ